MRSCETSSSYVYLFLGKSVSCLGAKVWCVLCFIGFFVPVDLVFVVVPVCWLNRRSRFIVVCLWGGFMFGFLCCFVGVLKLVTFVHLNVGVSELRSVCTRFVGLPMCAKYSCGLSVWCMGGWMSSVCVVLACVVSCVSCKVQNVCYP